MENEREGERNEVVAGVHCLPAHSNAMAATTPDPAQAAAVPKDDKATMDIADDDDEEEEEVCRVCCVHWLPWSM